MANLNLTFEAPNNVTSLIDMLGYFNNLTDTGQGGMFWTVMLIVFGGMLFLMMKSFSTERAFGITTFVVWIGAILFKLLNWVNNAVLTICSILMVAGVYLIFKEAAPYEQ